MTQFNYQYKKDGFTNIQIKRASKSEWETVNPVLKQGQMAWEVPEVFPGTASAGRIKIGDGSNRYNDLPYLI